MSSKKQQDKVLYPSDLAQTAAPGQAAADQAKKPKRGKKRGAFLEDGPAFEPADAERMRAASVLRAEERGAVHRKIGIMAVVLLLVFIVSSLVSVTYCTVYSPAVLVEVFKLWPSVTWDYITANPDARTTLEVMAICPEYYEVMSRIGISFQTVLCGGILALAGSLYQMVFRNPIAAPTMLGVSNGISMGILILVLQYTWQAPYMFAAKYLYCYVGAVVVLLLVLGISWFAGGRKHISVVQLLLVGAMLSQVLGAVVSFVSDMFMDDDLWVIYQEVSDALTLNTEPFAYIALIVSFLVAVVPVFLMRYSINAVNYSEDEARLAGIDSNKLKVICLVLATVMVIVAQIHCGQISMISLVIPFIARASFGTEFRGQLWGDILIGALLLLVCRDIVGLIPFTGDGVPIGTVVSFVLMPIYMIMLARRQRGWE